MMSTPTLQLTQLLDIDFSLIVAPMFLVSDQAIVVIAALESGVTGAISTLNYRTTDEFV